MPTWDPERLDRSTYPAGLDLPVFYGDLDTNGHVNNVALGRYFEMGRMQALRQSGLTPLIREAGGMHLVARVAMDYLAEIRLGTLHIVTRFGRVGTSSLVHEQAAFQKDRCVALNEVVFVRMQDGAVFAWPEAERVVLSSYRN